MNDLNEEVSQYIGKNPEKAIQELHNFLDSANDSNPKEQMEFNQYDFEQKQPDEEEDEFHLSNDARGNKYAM